MGELLSIDYYWQGAGWYIRKDIKEGDNARQEFHFFAPLITPPDEMRQKVKALEQPPYYLPPVTKIIKTRPAESGRIKVHDGAKEDK